MRGLRFDRLMSGVALALPLHGCTGNPAIQRPDQYRGDRSGGADAGRRPPLPPPTATDAAPATTQGDRDSARGHPGAGRNRHRRLHPPRRPAETADRAQRRSRRPTRWHRSTRPTVRSPRSCATCCRSPTASSPAARSASRSRRSTRSATTRRCGSSAASVSARAKAVIARIQASAADGLDPEPSTSIPELVGRHARRAGRGGAAPDRDADHLHPPSAGRPLPVRAHGRRDHAAAGAAGRRRLRSTKLAEATDVAAAIDEFSPPHPGYRALKAKLAELRGDDRRRGQGRPHSGRRRRCGPAWKTRAFRCCASGSTWPATRPICATTRRSSTAVKAYQKAERHERRRRRRRQPPCAASTPLPRRAAPT